VNKIPFTAKENKREMIDVSDDIVAAVKSPITRIRSNRPLDEIKLQDVELENHQVPIHAKKWIDYTSKYGLGYVLSDGSMGVFFNDATKIILDRKGGNFEYYEKQNKEECSSRHNIHSYAPELEKKVTLLKHFKSYLDQNFKEEDIEHV
jgi:hypothetical protein